MQSPQKLYSPPLTPAARRLTAVPRKPHQQRPVWNSMTAEQYKRLLAKQLLRAHSPMPFSAEATSRIDISRPVASVSLISDYQFECVLGRGGSATVHRAVHLPTCTQVAIKTYEKRKLLDATRRQGVQREIAVLGSLAHPNIVRLREVVEEEQRVHIVMDLVNGVSMHQFVGQLPDGRVREDLARPLFRQLLSAVAYCHEKAVAHRDLKLENILISAGSLVLIDFGFATRSPKRCTIFCGTSGYMAPELVQRKVYNALHADIWSAGVVLYTMLTGEKPFHGRTDAEFVAACCRGNLRFPRDLSTSVKSLIQGMLRRKPFERPSASTLLKHCWFSAVLTSGVSLRPLSPKVLSAANSVCIIDSASSSVYLNTA